MLKRLVLCLALKGSRVPLFRTEEFEKPEQWTDLEGHQGSQTKKRAANLFTLSLFGL
jgi:hypothetical protein